MDSVEPFQFGDISQTRHHTTGLGGIAGLCQYEVEPPEDAGVLGQHLNVRPQRGSELSQDSGNLPLLIELQLTLAVVNLHYLSRLDEIGLSGSRLVMHDTLDAPFVHRRDRNHQTSVTHGGSGISLKQPLLDGAGHHTAQNRVGCARYA